MRKLILVFALIALLCGCGAKVEQSASKSTEQPISKSTADTEIITRNVVMDFLLSQRIECEYLGTLDSDKPHAFDVSFDVVELTELTYDVTANDSKTSFEVKGTFHALGSIYEERPPFHPFLATDKPGSFRMVFLYSAYNDGNNAPFGSEFELTALPLVKPANPINLDNIPAYLQETDLFGNGSTTIYAPYDGGSIETPVGKVDVSSPNLRIVVLEDLSQNEYFLEQEFLVEVFEGDEYLCTGHLNVLYKHPEPVVFFDDFSDRLRKLR